MPRSVDTNVVVLPSGLAIAGGLNIGERQTANPVDPNATGSVNWLNVNGAVIAEIDAYFPDPIGGPTQHYARWGLNNGDGADAPSTQLLHEVDSSAAGFTRITARAKAKASSTVYSPTIIDAQGFSSFLMPKSVGGLLNVDTHIANGSVQTDFITTNTITTGPVSESWMFIAPLIVRADSANWTDIEALVRSTTGAFIDSVTFRAFHNQAASSSNTTYSPLTLLHVTTIPANTTTAAKVVAMCGGPFGGEMKTGSQIIGVRVI